ncbi:MAG: hypothetical protein AAFU80_01340 [Pseudomonadota bacterium]
MADAALIIGLIAAIAFLAWLKARAALRADDAQGRGLAPGQGDHIIEVEYSSGVGGGQSTQIRVPRDPQRYARRFVPKGANAQNTKDDT